MRTGYEPRNCRTESVQSDSSSSAKPVSFTRHPAAKFRNKKLTPPKINIEPENDGLEDDFPLPGVILRFHVNLRGCNM